MGIPGSHSHGKMGFPGSPFSRYIGDPLVRMGILLYRASMAAREALQLGNHHYPAS